MRHPLLYVLLGVILGPIVFAIVSAIITVGFYILVFVGVVAIARMLVRIGSPSPSKELTPARRPQDKNTPGRP